MVKVGEKMRTKVHLLSGLSFASPASEGAPFCCQFGTTYTVKD